MNTTSVQKPAGSGDKGMSMFLGQRDKLTADEDVNADDGESSSTAAAAVEIRPKSPSASRVHIAPAFQRSASDSASHPFPSKMAGLSNIRGSENASKAVRLQGVCERDLQACD